MTIASDAPLHCAAHPSVETYLRCGKCEKPICPKCLVYTPVGTRCAACAQVRALPTYTVGVSHLLLASLAGLALAIVAGIAWMFFRVGAFFLFWILPFYGVLAAETVSRAANRKRGPALATVAVSTIVLTFLISRLLPIALVLFSRPSPQFLSQSNIIGALFDPIALVLVVVASFIAVSRLR